MIALRMGSVLRCLAVGAAWALAACVADSDRDPQTTGTIAVQPISTRYLCDDQSSLTIETLGSSVRVIEAEGSSIDLPASPPTQSARFGGENRALVVENGEALYMVAGQPARTCRTG